MIRYIKTEIDGLEVKVPTIKEYKLNILLMENNFIEFITKFLYRDEKLAFENTDQLEEELSPLDLKEISIAFTDALTGEKKNK